MYKELIISIIIVAIIIIGDCLTQKYTEKCVSDLTDKMRNLKQEMMNISPNDDNIKNKANEIYDIWNECHDKLAYYIEHDELEKVETDFTSCKSFIENKEYPFAVSEIDKTIFVLDHISDKYAFNLQNIF